MLGQLDDAAYASLEQKATTLADGLQGAFDAAGIPALVPRVGPLVGLFFGSSSPDEAPTDFDSARGSVALGRYPEFFRGMLHRGIALAPGPYEVLFCSLAHGPDELARTIAAATEVAAAMEGST